MKSLLGLTLATLLFAASCTAPSGHKSQSWHPTSPKKAKQGKNR